MEKLLIIDGNSILNRAYYGIRMLNAPDGTPTNAVYGFLNIFFKYFEEESFDRVCVAFDVKEKTFRHKMYDLYKAQRKPAPEDFLVQLPLIKEVLGAMNIKCIECPGYEADDIIGTVSKMCCEEGMECRILTGDKDDLQLASDKVKISLVITRMGATTTTLFDGDAVYEKYGVTPKEFIDVKALMGDASDNIPGVKGIGEKTAFSLISEYKSIENIYENTETLSVTASVKKKLDEGKESAFFSKELATIVLDAPISEKLDDFIIKDYNREKLAEIFTRLNFKSFLSKLDMKETAAKTAVLEYEKKEVGAEEFSKLIKDYKKTAYKLGKNRLSLCPCEGKVYLLSNPPSETLKEFFENKNILKTGHNIKEDILALDKMGIGFEGIGFDTFVAAYILRPEKSTYELPDLALEYLQLNIEKSDGAEDAQISFNFDDGEEESETFFEETAVLPLLENKLFEKIKENGQEFLLEKVELPLIKVLADMQLEGVYVDKEALSAFGGKLKARIAALEDGIYGLAGKSFNINSPKQLGEILFEDLKLPHGKKMKTGYSTGIDVLKKLEPTHEIVRLIMEYRHLSKLMSTYVEGLGAVISKETGRIHSNFNQTVTTTGRISSTEPNLQNIPVRTEIGREIRKMFVAPKGMVLVDADYSQIELRVLAHVSGDENMAEAFRNNYDIHTATASSVFNTPYNEVTSEERGRAKAVNFGIVYGIGEFSLSQDLKISVKAARQYIEDYLAAYPKIKEYMQKTVEFGRENGYVKTMFERRRYLPELKATNKNIQAFGERMAMNAPIQGSAADIIKIAMVKVYDELKKRNMKSKLILQVHDELIIEAPKEEEKEVKALLKECMEDAAKLNLPLKASMSSGKSWFDTK